MKGDKQTEEEERESQKERQEKDRVIHEKEKAWRATVLIVCVSVQRWMCLCSRVCQFKCVCVCYGLPETLPCTLSKRIHVCRQNASVSQDTGVSTAHMGARAFCVVFCARTKKHIQQNATSTTSHTAKELRRVREERDIWDGRGEKESCEERDERWEDRSKMRRQRWAESEERKGKRWNYKSVSVVLHRCPRLQQRDVVQFRDSVFRRFHHTFW